MTACAPGPVRKAVLMIPLVCIALSAQSISPSVHSRTFHVDGTVRTFVMNSPVAGVEVRFEGERTTKTVSSDRSGFYRADLPVGAYKMTASWGRTQKYQRPLFLVATPAGVTLNIVLYPDDPDCDSVESGIIYPNGETKAIGLTADDYSDACGGRDLLPIPSKDGVPFELFVRYSRRKRSDTGNTYTGRPVFVAYNLLTLLADKVFYEADSQTIKASGNVVVANDSGKTQHVDSIAFKIEGGRATPLR